ncbi:MAG: winged helix-turn-helix transcriptional regulator [Labilithrix sp.]|nr:winged helix-turn-helix transcriptional regulator [Labilithrix sp.]MCW5810977.1 winged helix-turn-helix transcriptional regulator [Labilithrix sp.]
MARRRLPSFEETSPLGERIATGLHKLGLAMKQQTWLKAAEDGLSPTQGQILAALAGEGALTGTDLSKRLALTLPTISDSVKALVEKGLVLRRSDPRHPRASLLELTASGRARAASARAWPEFLAVAVDTMSEAEQEVFLSGLIKMIRALQESGQIPTNRMCVTCTHFRPHVHEGEAPHHCAYVDAAMADRSLRIDCPEHLEAPAAQRAAAWERFVNTS